MPEPQETQTDTPKRNYVRVFGPDNRYYRFPKGTTKDQAILFFRNKGISSPESPTPKTAKLSVKPAQEETFTHEHPFQAGVTRSFGFDPNRIAKAGDTEAQWKELASQAMHVHVPGLVKIIKDPLNVGKGIEDVAKSLESSSGMVYDGLRLGNHNLAWQGAGQLFGSIGQLLAGAEGRASLSKAASTTSGGVRAAAEVAGKAGIDAGEAARVAHNSSKGWLGRMIHNRAVLDQYVDAKGLDIANKVKSAVGEVDKEISSHVENLEKQIDTNLPSGVIDAAKEADQIKTSLQSIVKTPEALNARIAQLLADAKKTAPGQWSFAKARQFRTSIGRALGHIEGPQQKVAYQAYRSLGDKLGAVAKKYGLGKEWEHYNRLSSQFHEYYGKLADDIVGSKAGEQVANTLHKYKGLTNRFVENLSKYGLKPDEVTKYMNMSKKWLRQRESYGRGSLWRLAYGSPAGIGTMIAARAAGGGWLPSVAAGAVTGYLSTELTNALRAAKLSPDVLEHIAETTSIPGKMPKGTGNFPEKPSEGGAPSEPATPTKPKAPASSGPKFKGGIAASGVEASSKPATTEAKLQALKTEVQDLEGKLRKGAGSQKTQVESRLAETKGLVEEMEGGKKITLGGSLEQRLRDRAESGAHVPGALYTDEGLRQTFKIPQDVSLGRLVDEGVIVRTKEGMYQLESDTRMSRVAEPKRIPEGEHGKGKLAEQAKARERITKNRGVAKRTRQAETEEAQARAQSTGIDMSTLQIPEMEEALKSLEPTAFSALQKGRRAKLFSEQEYEPYLREMLLRAYEARHTVPKPKEGL